MLGRTLGRANGSGRWCSLTRCEGGLMEVTSEHRPGGGREPWGHLGESDPGNRHSKCKGTGAGPSRGTGRAQRSLCATWSRVRVR